MPVPFGRFDAVTLVFGAAALLAWTAAPWAAALTGALATGRRCLLHTCTAGALAQPGHPAGSAFTDAALGLCDGACRADCSRRRALRPDAARCRGTCLGYRCNWRHDTGGDDARHHGPQRPPAGCWPCPDPCVHAAAGAAALRLAGSAELAAGWDGITVSALVWTAGFALMVLKTGPWLVTRRIGPKKVSGTP